MSRRVSLSPKHPPINSSALADLIFSFKILKCFERNICVLICSWLLLLLGLRCCLRALLLALLSITLTPLGQLRLSDTIAARVRDQGKTMDQLQRLFLLVDSDGNCKLDPREFLNLMLLLEDRIQTPIDPDGPVVDQTRAKLHLRVAITPSGEDFLLRVQVCVCVCARVCVCLCVCV